MYANRFLGFRARYGFIARKKRLAYESIKLPINILLLSIAFKKLEYPDDIYVWYESPKL